MPYAKRRATIGVTWLMAAALVSIAGATGLAAEPAQGLTDAEAQRRYEEGQQASAAGRHREAAARFRDAFDHFRAPDLLWNVARSWERADELEQAREGYRELLAIDALDPALRADATVALAGVVARIEASNTAPAPVPPPPAEPDPLGPPTGPGPAPPPEAGAAPDSAASSLGPWITAGSGLAVAAIGGVLALVGQDKHDELEDAQAAARASGLPVDSLSRRRALSLREDGDTLKTAGYIGIGLGATAAVAGSVWLLTTLDREPDARVDVAVSPITGGAGVSVSGRF